jgi:transposase
MTPATSRRDSYWKKEAGRFILATKWLKIRLKPEEILQAYKNQQSCERGFIFLKAP